MMNFRGIIMTSLANEKPERIGCLEMQMDRYKAELIMERKESSMMGLAERLHCWEYRFGWGAGAGRG